MNPAQQSQQAQSGASSQNEQRIVVLANTLAELFGEVAVLTARIAELEAWVAVQKDEQKRRMERGGFRSRGM